jgi:signal peptidase
MKCNRPIVGHNNKRNDGLIIAILLLIYIYSCVGTINIIGIKVTYYFTSPLIWLGFALFMWKQTKVRPKAKLKHHQIIYWWAFNLGIISVFISMAAGVFVDNLGKSPYSHTFLGLLQNSFIAVTALMGRELARNHLVNRTRMKESNGNILLVAIFMAIISIPLKQFLEPEKVIDGVVFAANTVGPVLALNLMATYLASLGGTRASLTYLGILEGFQWFSPILPDLQWITEGFVGIVTPFFAYLIIQYMYEKKSRSVKKHVLEKEGPLGWIITSLLSVAIIWFTVGVFPIYPSVIATGSMEPMIKPGDVILVKKVDRNDVKVSINDVIQFDRDNILISHRIIEIGEDEEGTYYTTKGDNNSTADSRKVKPQEVRGKIILVVPKIGWSTLILKQDKDNDVKDIKF